MLCDLTQSYSAVGGGIRTYLHAKRAYLMEHTPHRHVLIVPGDRDETRTRGRLTTVTIRSPFVPGSTAYRLLLRNRAVGTALARHRPDVIETLDAYNLPWAALAHRKRHPQTVVIAGYRTDFPRAYAGPFAERLVRRVLPERWARALAERAEQLGDRYSSALYPRMDAVYALSAERAVALGRLGVHDVRTIPLGVDLDTFRPGAADDAQRAAWGAGPRNRSAPSPVLIYAGRLDQEKQPNLLVDAFERLPEPLDATLVLLGDGPLRGGLEERAARLSRRGRRVVVGGYIADRHALARALASADLYVSAMAHETFGISILEAQACGLPVVGVAAGAMTVRVPGELGMLAPPGDAAALSHAIQMMLQRDLSAVGERAREHVSERYGWRATFEAILDLGEHARRSRRIGPCAA